MKRETDLEWNLGERQQYRPGRREWTYREAAKEPGGRERNLQSEAQEARGQGFPRRKACLSLQRVACGSKPSS